LPSKYVTVQDVAVHYLHTGPTTLPDTPPALDRGQLFLLVHAAGSNAAMWRRQIEGLGGRHSVVAVDLPGHGRTSGVDGLATIDAYADFLIEFMAAVRLRRCVLVGRSMGGAVGVAIAARRPELVSGLVLTCTACRFVFEEAMLTTLRDVVRGRLPQQFTTETFSSATGMELMREAWMEQVKTDPRVRYTDLLACQAFDGRALLGRIATPTLVVGGGDDRVTPAEQAKELAGGIRGARLEVFDQAGHQAPLEQSERFNALVASFAESLA
jgi:3-oxoadipate enol-lactonase/4-carboxymuconolactone decarboxylase